MARKALGDAFGASQSPDPISLSRLRPPTGRHGLTERTACAKGA